MVNCFRKNRVDTQELSSQSGLQLKWPLCTSHILASCDHPTSLNPLPWMCWDTASSSYTALQVFVLLSQPLPGYSTTMWPPFCMCCCLEYCFGGWFALTFVVPLYLTQNFSLKWQTQWLGTAFLLQIFTYRTVWGQSLQSVSHSCRSFKDQGALSALL